MTLLADRLGQAARQLARIHNRQIARVRVHRLMLVAGRDVQGTGPVAAFAADCRLDDAVPLHALVLSLAAADVAIKARGARRSLEAGVVLLVAGRQSPRRLGRVITDRRLKNEAVRLDQVGLAEAPGAHGVLHWEFVQNDVRLRAGFQQFAVPELATAALDVVAPAGGGVGNVPIGRLVTGIDHAGRAAHAGAGIALVLGLVTANTGLAADIFRVRPGIQIG